MYLRVLKARIQDFERRGAKDFIAPVQIFFSAPHPISSAQLKIGRKFGRQKFKWEAYLSFFLLIKITKLSNDVDAPGFLSCFHQAN